MNAHSQAEEKPNPLRVLIDLQQSQETEHRVVPGVGLDTRLASLRLWQSERLKHTYADLLTDERYAPACQFFLNDVYAAQDFSQRDHDVEALYALLRRFVPVSMLSLIADAIELNQLTSALDNRLLEVLVVDQGKVDEITPAVYAAGYRACDNYVERLHQIDLIARILREVAEGAGKPLVMVTLKAARVPAERFGWVDLYEYLVRGQAAFRRLGRKNDLSETIRQREKRILDRIFEGETDPFS
jgi:hypothetical protein